jgi:beta-carotene ketolase (CrtW type)
LSASSHRGLAWAALILLGWLASLVLLLPMDGLQRSPALLLMAVLLRTQLQTGLFIVAHDAMHGVLVPGAAALNDRIGALGLGLYAAVPYGRCRLQHQQHHRAPGGDHDPDFHAPGRRSFLAWYGQFMAGYLSVHQLTLLLAAWGLLAWGTSLTSVLLLCTLPLILSSLQLFVVGTYLPHRGPQGENGDHHAISLDLPEWLSLLACYHFGYHLEHHLAPELAWHQLPERHQQVARLAFAQKSDGH